MIGIALPLSLSLDCFLSLSKGKFLFLLASPTPVLRRGTPVAEAAGRVWERGVDVGLRAVNVDRDERL